MSETPSSPKHVKNVAIVTGGGTGIGRAVCLALASAGSAVCVVYSTSEHEGLETVAQIAGNGGEAMAVRANVADAASVDRMTQDVLRRFGRIDYLINNAGITHQLPFNELEAIEDGMWDDLYATNVKGAFNCARAAASFLTATAGSIVNVGSIAGETGYGSSIPYAVSKAALHGLTKSLARALAPRVRVNCVAPGAVATRWWQGNEAKMQILSGNLPLQRISTPQDIADLVVSLLRTPSMTGQIIRADNGQTL